MRRRRKGDGLSKRKWVWKENNLKQQQSHTNCILMDLRGPTLVFRVAKLSRSLVAHTSHHHNTMKCTEYKAPNSNSQTNGDNRWNWNRRVQFRSINGFHDFRSRLGMPLNRSHLQPRPYMRADIFKFRLYFIGLETVGGFLYNSSARTFTALFYCPFTWHTLHSAERATFLFATDETKPCKVWK